MHWLAADDRTRAAYEDLMSTFVDEKLGRSATLCSDTVFGLVYSTSRQEVDRRYGRSSWCQYRSNGTECFALVGDTALPTNHNSYMYNNIIECCGYKTLLKSIACYILAIARCAGPYPVQCDWPFRKKRESNLFRKQLESVISHNSLILENLYLLDNSEEYSAMLDYPGAEDFRAYIFVQFEGPLIRNFCFIP